MVIQHNIMALNAHRQFGGNTSTVAKNLEKLSSGYKINRAGDDAAGLAISEKMRSQIKGLDRAKLNAQDGISLVQTAEGALTETHSMLNRLVELATESANGTIQADDRQKVQSEVDALLGEIDRISQATNFNGINLLDGALGEAGAITANIKYNGVKPTETVSNPTKTTYGATEALGAITNGGTITYVDAKGDTTTLTLSYTASTTAKGGADSMAAALNADAKFSALFTATAHATDGTISFEAKNAGASKARITSMTTTGTNADTGLTVATPTLGADKSTAYAITDGSWKAGDKIDVGGKTYTWNATATGTDGKTFKDFAALQAAALLNKVTVGGTDGAATFSTDVGGGLKMQVGDTADSFNQVVVSVNDMSSAGLSLSGLSLEMQDDAAGALERIKAAVETVSVARGTLGALQNRLEHTINNLGVTSENMTAAESRIRDVDMAKEMMDFTKNNVLTQAAQAMLAQANQQPQQVLQLLR